MRINKLKSHAKINLALNITGKKKLLHKIESIVGFIDLHDVISINEIKTNEHKISFYGKFSKKIGKKNTVEKLFAKLDKNSLLNKKKFRVRIKKNIPQEAGLGGGSMNAANVFNYLIKKKYVKLSQKKIKNICDSIGSDVFLGIDFVSCILSSNSRIKKFHDCPKYYTVCVKPNFGCSTKKIYSYVKTFSLPRFSTPKKYMFYPKFLTNQRNALEEIAFKNYPKLKKIALFLTVTKNPIFVRMTGSGSTIIAYYNSLKNCKIAKAKFKRKFKNYWCITSKTI